MVESRGIGQSESGAISIMRILAMFSIIVCHLLQAYNNRYAGYSTLEYGFFWQLVVIFMDVR